MKIKTPNGYTIEVTIDELEDLMPQLAKDIKREFLDMQSTQTTETNLIGKDQSNEAKIKLIRDIIERKPDLPNGQKGLYSVLYAADKDGLDYETLAEKMGRDPRTMSGVLGALGRRINGTNGVVGKPGVEFLLTYKHSAPPKNDWGWAMSDDVRNVLEHGTYPWLSLGENGKSRW